MRHRRTRRMVSVLVAGVLLFQILAQATIATYKHSEDRGLAVAPGNAAFQITWERTDQPVASGQTNRTWMWGPQAFSEVLTEDYIPVNSDITKRQVQYFDKSRMEITDPDGDSSSIWYVTNGLLVRELMTGEMQVGDQEWVTRFPADVNVAGDADDPDGPTYATFTEHSFPASTVSPNEGVTATQRIDRFGSITNDPTLSVYGVTTTRYVPETGHHVASVFWDFMRTEGTIYVDGEFTSGLLFPNEFYATGFPISEPYWATVRVGGTPKDVLVQCFDRRCLTYTPDNPEGWQVEAGNVGQHYYTWRYETEEPEETFLMPYLQREGLLRTIYTMNSDGTNQQPLGINEDLWVVTLSLSPDGETVAFPAWTDVAGGTDVYRVAIDGSGFQKLTDLNAPAMFDIEWSPDGSTILFSSNHGDSDLSIYTVNTDGSNLTPVLTGDNFWAIAATWSPDGSQIAVSTNRDCEPICLWALNIDGSNARMLREMPPNALWLFDLDWSPDGDEIAYVMGTSLGDEESDLQLMIMSSDGSTQRRLIDSPNVQTISWDPGSEKLFFSDNRYGDADIYVVDRKGTNERRLTEGSGDQFYPSPPSK